MPTIKSKIGDMVIIYHNGQIDCGVVVNISPDFKVMTDNQDQTFVLTDFDQDFSNEILDLIWKLKKVEKSAWIATLAQFTSRASPKARSLFSDIVWFLYMKESVLDRVTISF